MATKAVNNGDNVDAIANMLESTKVKQQNIVSFKGLGLKLNNADDAKEIIEAISKAADLQVLELGGNTIGVDAAKAIAAALEHKAELERCLWADMFTGRLRSEIPPSLISLGDAIMSAHAHLVEIDLSDNAFGPDGVKACVDLLKSEAAYTIEVLKFNNNGLGIGGKILAETLIECHQKSSKAGKPLALKVFIAGRNRLENPGAIALAGAFKTIGTLEEIQMPQNGINHQGITAMAEAVKNSPNLRLLNLNDNTFSVIGACAMAQAIKEINSLKIINFGDCLVRTEGASAIGNSLANSNPDLETLILSYGEVQLEGGLCVCEGVSNKENLKVLDLNGNQFGEDGVDEILDLAAEFGFSDSLAPLSDDEGIESDGEDDRSSESEDEDDSNEEKDNVGYSNGYAHGEQKQIDTDSITSDCFPDKVSAAALLALEKTRRKELVESSVKTIGPVAEDCVEACIKMSSLLGSALAVDARRLEEAVFECCDQYLLAAFRNCPERPMRVVDRILIRLGLLKSEDKSVKAISDARPLLKVLENALKQSYYPQNTRKVVRAMVGKSNKIWDKNMDLQNQLLRILY